MSEMTSIERELGNLQARMEAVEHELQAIRSDIREIRDAVTGARGGWRVLMLTIGLATTLGAALEHALRLFTFAKP